MMRRKVKEKVEVILLADLILVEVNSIMDSNYPNRRVGSHVMMDADDELLQ